MKAKLIKIGNHQAIRLPREVIEQLGLKGEVEYEIINNQLVIKSGIIPETDWDTIFKRAAQDSEPDEWDDEDFDDEWE